MARSILRAWATTAMAATVALAAVGVAQTAQADNYDVTARREAWYQTAPPLFSNYYVQPYACGGVPAQLYISPVPTPAVVGHTYVTYQPFMPHEYMYQHRRVYYKWHDRGGNFTRTTAWWW